MITVRAEGDYPYEYRFSVIQKNKVELIGYEGAETELVLPHHICCGDEKYLLDSIGTRAFADHKELRRITVHPDTQNICALAFENCRDLQVIYSLTTTKIYGNTFRGCFRTLVTVPYDDSDAAVDPYDLIDYSPRRDPMQPDQSLSASSDPSDI